MNYSDRFLREIANYSPLDVMLADIAVRIQLSPTDYQRAVEHYHAINEWIDREDSPLHGLVEEFYAQGGFAIGATVARHATDDEFDIDVMAQLTLPAGVDPEVPLYLLDNAIRTTFIFHSKPSDPSEPKQALVANPFGFAQWFLANTPADEAFADFFERRSLDYDRMRLLEKADTAPVPQQMPAYRKSRAVIALQLIKRWRNLAYDRRHKSLRRPPSVLLAYYVAEHANSTRTLADELIHQVERAIARLQAAEQRRETVCEFNPTCREDELTDRWPCDLAKQRVFLNELRAFAVQLHRLRQGVPLAEMQHILEDLFGERPARDAVRKYMDQHVSDNDAGKAFHILRTGSVPALGSAATPSIARATPRSSPFGD